MCPYVTIHINAIALSTGNFALSHSPKLQYKLKFLENFKQMHFQRHFHVEAQRVSLTTSHRWQ